MKREPAYVILDQELFAFNKYKTKKNFIVGDVLIRNWDGYYYPTVLRTSFDLEFAITYADICKVKHSILLPSDPDFSPTCYEEMTLDELKVEFAKIRKQISILYNDQKLEESS